MIFRFKNAIAWRRAIEQGTIPIESLGQTSPTWTGGSTGKTVVIDDRFFDQTIDTKTIPGMTLLPTIPSAKPKQLEGLWNLFGPEKSIESKPFLPSTNWLVRFHKTAVAAPVIDELLKLGNHGSLRHLPLEGSYWIWASTFSHLTWLKLQALATVDLFHEAHAGFWIPFGTIHPLEGILTPPSQTGTWRILDQQNQTTTLNFREFTPLLGDIKWALPDPVTFEPSVLHMPEWTIPLTLRSDVANTSRPDLWVIEDHDKAPFRDWLTQANGDIRESFRYGVLAKPGPLLLLRIREIPANSAGDPPGRAFFHQRATPGLYLPQKSRLFPDPGPEITRRLFGLDLDRLVWLTLKEDTSFHTRQAPRAALKSLDTFVRFVIESEAEQLKTWAKSVEFSWENPPQVEEDFPMASDAPLSLPSAPENAPATKKKRKQSEKRAVLTKPTLEPEPVILQNPVPLTRKTASNIVGPNASEQVVLEFETAQGPWDSPQRESLWPQLKAAWQAEGQIPWTALTHLHELWKQHEFWKQQTEVTTQTGALLLEWHTSLARKIGRPEQPDLLALTTDWPIKNPGPDHQNWFLTGLILEVSSQKTAGTSNEFRAFQTIHDTLCHDCLDAPIRLLWFGWLALESIFDNPTATLAGGEKLLVKVLEGGIRPSVEWPLPLVAKSHHDQTGTNQGLSNALEGVMAWLTSQGMTHDSCRTLAIIQWTFAFGFARLGEGKRARQLGELAQTNLATEPLGGLLSRAYSHRVNQALQGTNASGPLESPWLREAAALGKWTTFALDYLRETSRILEPHQSVRAFPAGDPLQRLLDPLGHPGALGRTCRDAAPSSPNQPDAESRWAAILDRILILPTADACHLLEGARQFLQSRPNPGSISLRIGARVLAAEVFFQNQNPPFLDWMIRQLIRPGAIGLWLGGKTPGMDKGYFQFTTRQIPLLFQLGARGLASTLLEALCTGMDSMPPTESTLHARFLLDCQRVRLAADPVQLLESVESKITQEMQNIQLFNQQRNEPWQALCQKVVAYIQALASVPETQFRQKLVSIPHWILPIRDYFATAPKLRETAQRLCYQRHQIEWIEALVLAITETAPVRISEWIISDEKILRTRIRGDLARIEKNLLSKETSS